MAAPEGVICPRWTGPLFFRYVKDLPKSVRVVLTISSPPFQLPPRGGRFPVCLRCAHSCLGEGPSGSFADFAAVRSRVMKVC